MVDAQLIGDSKGTKTLPNRQSPWVESRLPSLILESAVVFGSQIPPSATAVLLTAFLFALFHQPANVEHWVSFTVTGVAYGWIRAVSRTTTAAALMHPIYNVALWLSATF